MTDAGQGNLSVTLKVVPLSEMYEEFSIDEVVDLSTVEAQITQSLAGYYDAVRQPDGSFEFTLKAGATAQKAGAVGTKALGPFGCRSDLPIPLKLDKLPTSFKFTPSLRLITKFDDTAVEQKLAVQGTIQTDFTLKASLTAALEAKVTCDLEVVAIPVPVTGVPFLYAGAAIPLGLGFEIGGKLTLAGIGFELTFKPSLAIEGGLQCSGPSCSFYMTGDLNVPAPELKTSLPSTANIDAQFRIEPKVALFAFADLVLAAKLAVFRLDWGVLRLQGEIAQMGNFATVEAQDAG